MPPRPGRLEPPIVKEDGPIPDSPEVVVTKDYYTAAGCRTDTPDERLLTAAVGER